MQEKVSGIANQIGYQRYLAEYAGFTGQDSSALLENVNFKDYYGKTPIFSQSSAWNGDARLLIDLGANVHVADNYGVPPPLTSRVTVQTQGGDESLAGCRGGCQHQIRPD